MKIAAVTDWSRETAGAQPASRDARRTRALVRTRTATTQLTSKRRAKNSARISPCAAPRRAQPAAAAACPPDAASCPPASGDTKPKRICCACPETRKPRDECTMMHGEEKCAAQIEAHKACLRAEGFNV